MYFVEFSLPEYEKMTNYYPFGILTIDNKGEDGIMCDANTIFIKDFW
ncbi:hypothetical protein [Conservatibacter flavescens]|nr:hypothetical protein [Conservatibacter flavescens]